MTQAIDNNFWICFKNVSFKKGKNAIRKEAVWEERPEAGLIGRWGEEEEKPRRDFGRWGGGGGREKTKARDHLRALA